MPLTLVVPACRSLKLTTGDGSLPLGVRITDVSETVVTLTSNSP